MNLSSKDNNVTQGTTIKEADMRTRKAMFILFMVGCLAAFSAVAAQAAWITCTVDQVGPSGTNVDTSGCRIFLTAVDPADAWVGSKEFKISPNRGKEFLAAALTALASGKQVRVNVNLATAMPTLGAIYVQK
ncbi:MAG: hypothetical protein C4567_07130 [Deltaproteobacteria bacterium]|nr:MAG: hypothetical protein C4567_07130 [Deltaproteobacteria bacterium]